MYECFCACRRTDAHAGSGRQLVCRQVWPDAAEQRRARADQHAGAVHGRRGRGAARIRPQPLVVCPHAARRRAARRAGARGGRSRGGRGRRDARADARRGDARSDARRDQARDARADASPRHACSNPRLHRRDARPHRRDARSGGRNGRDSRDGCDAGAHHCCRRRGHYPSAHPYSDGGHGWRGRRSSRHARPDTDPGRDCRRQQHGRAHNCACGYSDAEAGADQAARAGARAHVCRGRLGRAVLPGAH